MQRYCGRTLIPASVLLAAASLVLAQAPSRVAVPTIAVDGKQCIRQMAEFYGKTPSFMTEATVQADVAVHGQRLPATLRYIFSAARPNKLALLQKTALPSQTVVCDGKNLYKYQPATLQYSQAQAPSSLAAINGKELAEAGEGLGTVLFWLIQADPYQAIMRGVTKVEYVAQDVTSGSKVHHVRLIQKSWTIDMWIDAGDKAVLRKMVVAPLPGGGSRGSINRPTAIITFGNWTLDGTVPDETFRFVPPPSARRADEEEMEFPAYGLKGKPAPLFVLNLVGDGRVSLTALKGKVVILDFWATWCPPCRKGLPILAEIAKEYKDKGVEFYAVNCHEPTNRVREFLSQSGLSMTVALDTDGAVGKRYFVEGIPQTVVIDKTGVVRVIHVGLPTDLRDRMHKDLDALLAGKSLVSN